MPSTAERAFGESTRIAFQTKGTVSKFGKVAAADLQSRQQPWEQQVETGGFEIKSAGWERLSPGPNRCGQAGSWPPAKRGPMEHVGCPASINPGRVTSSGSTERPAVVTSRSIPARRSSRTPLLIAFRSSGTIMDCTTLQLSASALAPIIGTKRSLTSPWKTSLPVTRSHTGFAHGVNAKNRAGSQDGYCLQECGPRQKERNCPGPGEVPADVYRGITSS